MLTPGTRLGPYEIVSPVAAGAMGEVYRARDSRLEREVALKVLPDAFATDRDRMARFEREAKALAAFTHPNIVQIYDIGEQDGRAFIAMEYVDGRTLRALLDDGALSPDQVLDFATQIASGLAKAHSAGIIHRDLKPANLIVDTDGVVKILDFGLARVAVLPEGGSSVATLEPAATSAGAIVGTPGFMSPEQVKGQPTSFQSDHFSLGAILYEMAAGAPAFRRNTAAESLAAVLHETTPKLSRVPPSVGDVIERCLKKDPGERFDSTAELLEALHHSETRGVVTDEISIAVVPFKNLSRDEDAEFFSDGLTDEIILDLSKVGRLRVISRTSAMMLKGSEKDLRTLARELGVRYVLEGNVRATGPRVRVTAKLIDAENDEHVWGERFSGTNDDIFAIQEDLSRKIVDALEVTLTPREDRALAERPFEDIRAYECYARARQEQWGFNADALERALRLIDDGLAIVGDHELLYAAKGAIHAQFMLSGTRPWKVSVSEATRFCEKAHALGARTSQAHYLRGLLSAFSSDLNGAAKDFKRALEIQPDDPDALSSLCHTQLWAGNTTVARPLLARLFEVDPLTASNYWFAGLIEMYEGSYDAAVDKMQTWWEKDSNNPFPGYFLANVLARAGRVHETASLRERVRELQPDGILAQIGSVYQCAERNDPDGALAAVSPELREIGALHLGFAGDVASALGLARATDEALAFLERTIELGWSSPDFWGRHDPSFDYLHGDERFERIIDRAREKSAAFEV